MSEQSAFPFAPEGLPGGRLAGEELVNSEEVTVPMKGSVGQRLRAAREARQMSLADVAQALKLGSRQVEALEAEDWASLPGNTMIRGFVRNYARLLNIDSDVLMRGLDAVQLQQTAKLEVSAGTSASLPQAIGRRVERRDYLAVFAGLLLLGLSVLVYFYLPQDFWQEKMTTLLGRNSAPTAAESPVAVPAAGPAPAAVSGESVTLLATPNKTVLSDTPASGGGLKLSFTQPAWVEIRDGGGQIIFSGLGQAGSQREVNGQAPFAVVVGNASYVTVEYRGRMIDLSPHSKGDVARFTLE